MMIIDQMVTELFDNSPTLNEEWFARLGSVVAYIVSHPSGGSDVPLAFMRFDIAKLQMGTSTLSLTQRLQGNLDLVIALTVVSPQGVSGTPLTALAARADLTDRDYALLALYAASAFAKSDSRLMRKVDEVLVLHDICEESSDDRLTGQRDIVLALTKQLVAQAQRRALIAAIDREQRALVQAVVSSQNLGPSTSELAKALGWSPERTICVAKHLVAAGVLHRFVNRVSPGDARWRLTVSEQRVLYMIA